MEQKPPPATPSPLAAKRLVCRALVALAVLVCGVAAAQTLPFCGLQSAPDVAQTLIVGKPNSFPSGCYIAGQQDRYELDITTHKWQHGVTHECTLTNQNRCTPNEDQPCPGNTCAPSADN